jgi:hypothetical protein
VGRHDLVGRHAEMLDFTRDLADLEIRPADHGTLARLVDMRRQVPGWFRSREAYHARCSDPAEKPSNLLPGERAGVAIRPSSANPLSMAV